MRENRASLTAMVVSAARGVAGAADGRRIVTRDPYAAELLPRGWSDVVRWTDWVSSFAPRTKRIVRRLFVGAGAHIEYRTFAIDRALADALDAGWQLVILGAGLDSRAWRLPGIRGVDVVEIDHPATQRLKRARIGRRSARARSVTFLDVDFTSQSLSVRLDQHSLDRSRPTAWIWEGVTPYLPESATRSTLRAIASATDGEALLLMTYALPELANLPGWLRPITRQGFFAIAEPLDGAMKTARAHELVSDVGFVVTSDTDSVEWALDADRTPPRLRFLERLLVARRA